MSGVLRMAHVSVAKPSKVERPAFELTPEFRRSLPNMSKQALQQMDEHYEALHQRFEEAKREREATPKPSPPPVAGQVTGVEVVLNPNGAATTVRFDEKWLDSAQAGQISESVMRAAKQAYSRFEPHSDEDDLQAEMAQEYDYYRKVVYAMLTPKEQR